jgi:uncharacterized protein involved in exopolysaccharide biosynthesis
MRDYLETFFRRKWLFWVPFLAVLAVAVAGGLYSVWQYEVQARIEIRPSASAGTTTTGTAAIPATDLATEYGSLSDALLTDGFMEQVINAVPQLKAKADSPTKMDSEIARLRTNLNAWTPGKSLIQIRYQDRDPDVALQVVSQTISLFLTKRAQDRVGVADKNIAFWTAQQKDREANLTTASQALTAWENAHPVGERSKLPDVEQLNFQRLKADYDAALDNVKTTQANVGVAQMDKAYALDQQQNTYHIVDPPTKPEGIALSLNKIGGLLLVGLLVAVGLGASIVALATWLGAGRARAGANNSAPSALPAWLDRMMSEEQTA